MSKIQTQINKLSFVCMKSKFAHHMARFESMIKHFSDSFPILIRIDYIKIDLKKKLNEKNVILMFKKCLFVGFNKSATGMHVSTMFGG